MTSSPSRSGRTEPGTGTAQRSSREGEPDLEFVRSLLDATLESTTDAIILIDNDRRVTGYNRHFLDLWGIPESVIAGRNGEDLVAYALPHIKDSAAFLDRAREIKSDPESEFKDLIEFVDGRMIERYSRPQRIDGVTVGRAWSFRDVTGPQPLERELHFESLFENCPVPMWVYRLDTLRFVEVNRAAVEKYGYSQNEFLAMRSRDIRAPENETIHLEGSAMVPGYSRHQTKDGRILTVKTASQPIEIGHTIGVLVLAQDVGELVRTQRALSESEDRVRAEASRARSLLAVAERLNAQLDVHSILETVCDEMTKGLSATAAAVLLYDEATQSFVATATRGLPTEAADRYPPIARAIFEQHLERAGDVAFVIPDVSKAVGLSNRDIYQVCGIRSIVCALMIREGAFVGILAAFSLGRPRTFRAEELVLLKGLADHATQAIANARYFGEFQRSTFELSQAYETTLEGWARALDLRDHETEGHCRRVRALTERLGLAMGVPPDELVHMRRGALLHDIGKMGIPDRILLKGGKLDEDEWVIMRKHPVYAKQLLENIPYLCPALDIPYSHHERWDGSGYPQGLRGTEISASARIFAVTDVWDSLTSNRPYREAWSPARARRHIRSRAGIHFDPIAVEAFLDLSLRPA